MFGKNEADLPLLSVVPLNVTDPSNVSYLEAYTDPNAATLSNNGTDNNANSNADSNNSEGSGLSTGATAGIAVGAVIGVSTK